MNRLRYFYFICLVFLPACKPGGSSEPLTLYSRDFNWSITIPDNFTAVSAEDWEKLQRRGAQAVEKTFGEKVSDRTSTIFVFRNGDFNYLESNYQSFDTDVEGDYSEACRGVYEIVFETFRTQIPGAKIDSVSGVERISGIDFRTFKIVVDLPNDMTLTSHMYSRLFGKKDFSVNITYVDGEQGERMLDAWRRSVFK